MTKITAPKKKIIKKDPQVNENPIKEEVVEVVEEVMTKEVQFTKALERIIEQNINDGGNRFLGLEEILPTFRSIMK